MKTSWQDLFLLIAGVLVMIQLLYLGAASEGWLSLLCFLGTAVVYTGWYRHLLSLARRMMGGDIDDDDTPFFPG